MSFSGWDDVFRVLAAAARDEPLLFVIDEFAELHQAEPNIESTLRAVWEEVPADSKPRVLLTGSAVRAMEALQTERAPLFGRATLRLHLRPFTPGESALMLRGLVPAERAKAWGVCGGTPYYLDLWDNSATFQANLQRLVCTEHGLLLNEGELVLATEDFAGGRRERLPEQVMRAIATSHTSFSEEGFSDFMGQRWEEAFRRHLAEVAQEDDRLRPVAGIGEFWMPGTQGDKDPCELDAVVLTGRARTVSLVGEAKWAEKASGARLLRGLERKALESGLPLSGELVYALCAREQVTHLPEGRDDIIVVTAADIFG